MARIIGPNCAVMCWLKYIHTHIHTVDYRAGLRGYVQFGKYTHTHTHIPWEDQCEWHRMTRMTGLDCAVMCNLKNTHTHTHTHGSMRVA